jgi:hypothetical protein
MHAKLELGSYCLSAFDRREFLGAAVATALLPATALIPAGPVAAAVTGPAPLADWTIDDQWMGYPRYAEAIGCGRPRQSLQKPKIHPADLPFVPY